MQRKLLVILATSLALLINPVLHMGKACSKADGKHRLHVFTLT